MIAFLESCLLERAKAESKCEKLLRNMQNLDKERDKIYKSYLKAFKEHEESTDDFSNFRETWDILEEAEEILFCIAAKKYQLALALISTIEYYTFESHKDIRRMKYFMNGKTPHNCREVLELEKDFAKSKKKRLHEIKEPLMKYPQLKELYMIPENLPPSPKKTKAEQKLLSTEDESALALISPLRTKRKSNVSSDISSTKRKRPKLSCDPSQLSNVKDRNKSIANVTISLPPANVPPSTTLKKFVCGEIGCVKTFKSSQNLERHFKKEHSQISMSPDEKKILKKVIKSEVRNDTPRPSLTHVRPIAPKLIHHSQQQSHYVQPTSSIDQKPNSIVPSRVYQYRLSSSQDQCTPRQFVPSFKPPQMYPPSRRNLSSRPRDQWMSNSTPSQISPFVLSPDQVPIRKQGHTQKAHSYQIHQVSSPRVIPWQAQQHREHIRPILPSQEAAFLSFRNQKTRH